MVDFVGFETDLEVRTRDGRVFRLVPVVVKDKPAIRVYNESGQIVGATSSDTFEQAFDRAIEYTKELRKGDSKS